ncbi:hypothetical protein HPP92_016854 [Vanilla planifolia]|uniref:monogalactosyldiacylglycerol synthase n=1 Tax=Vanilla planifolia TaxID=51239 RepID=A0A835QPI7_VANPL|nr:hypothetical protein HPP92_016854 [Vanilla planifolia]
MGAAQFLSREAKKQTFKRRSEKPVVSCFLLSTSSKLQTFLIEYSRFVQLDCGRLPVGLGSLGVSLNDGNPLEENGHGVIVEEALPVNGVAVEAPKKVLILMSDTGGGHRASAEAIKAAFNQEFGEEYQVFVTDLWTDHTPWPFNQLPRSYNFLVKHGALWKMTYYGSALVFHKLVTRCYCPSSEVAKRALKAGLKPSQVKVYGLPVRPSFVKPVQPKDELRREFGMNEDLPAVLLMGGGEGMGPIEATARALGETLYDDNLGEPIVIRTKAFVEGFVTKMEECMGACDCIITKAGPGTIAEAMIRGLPIILNGYIAGQEVGNVPYVVENGWESSPNHLKR